MKYKYDAEMRGIADCPPADVFAPNQIAYRFVFKTSGSESFVANANDTIRFPDGVPCIAHALSFFETADCAKEFFLELRERVKLIGKKLGDHLAEVELKATDGVRTKANAAGHFSFFEFENFSPVSEVIESLDNV